MQAGGKNMLFEDGAALPGSVAQELRGLIVRGALLPGEHLGQTELAARFGRSKVPIREALKHLATEGFLRHDRNRGYFVAPLDLGEAMQLYKLRRWLESELLESARWPDADELAALRAACDAVAAVDPARDYDGWSRALEELRYAIFDLSPHKLLLNEAIRSWRLTDRYRGFLPRNIGQSPERALVDALERRDRAQLLATYHAVRDTVEGLLAEAIGPEG